MENDNSTVYDDVLRTIQERRPKLLIPLINEVFHIAYPVNGEITRLPEEYQKLVSKVVADSCNRIGGRIYHMECQSTRDGKMMLRMVEYDFMIALADAVECAGHYKLRMPRSCILYLRGGSDADAEELELELADGQVLRYRVPCVQLTDYTADEIFRKNLLLFLPYYIMRYEKDFGEIARNHGRTEDLVQEYRGLLERLGEATKADAGGLFQDLVRLMRRILDYQLRREKGLRERMDEVMGGKVLDLPSDKLREERERGLEQGMERGLERGLRQGIEALIETCKELGVSSEAAKEKLKAKFCLSAEEANGYMEKYW